MKKLNVLVPSANRVTHPSLCKSLRNNGEREIRIVGVDMVQGGIGPHIVDAFYKVPPRKDPAFMESMLDICKKEAIDVYYALSDDEALTASVNRDAFNKIGTSIITPGTPEMLTVATNKSLWHEFFAVSGVPHAGFVTVSSINTIAAAAYELGYPDRDVVFKPAVSTGGRGAIIVTARDISNEYYTSRSELIQMSLESFVNMLLPLRTGNFKTLLAMEYLPGTYYSVDVLSRDGQIIYAVPKIRIAGTASNTVVGQVDLNPDTISLASQACRAFGFSYLQNYEMKLNRNGKPMIYDINPRGGSSVAFCAAAGANIAYFAVKMAVGEEIPGEKNIKNGTKMIRFYDEHYE